MKNKRNNLLRILCLGIVILMLLPMVMSCKDKESNETETQAVVADEYLDDLGAYDFGGVDFVVLSVESQEGTYTLFDIQEYNDSILDRSVYKRNREIEQRFNFKFDAHTEKQYGKCIDALTLQASSGEHTYDLIECINRAAYSAAISGQILPVSALTKLDTTKDYYLQDINKMGSINGKMFLAYSDLSIYTFQRAACLAFNKNMATDNQLGDLYAMVENNTWTYEEMYKMARQATRFDGDGKTEVYGMYGQGDYILTTIYLAAGENLIENNNGKLEFNIGKNQKLDTITRQYLTEYDAGYLGYELNYNDETWNDNFINSKALFNGTVIGKLFLLRGISEFDYGVLPWPKYDAEQEQYYSRVIDAWLHVVPTTCPDAEKASVILEALAAGSSKYVFPAYYENALTGQVVRDYQSVEMLELIRSNRVFDWGDITWATTIRTPILTHVYGSRKMTLASLYGTIRTQVNTLIEEAYAGAAKLQ